MRRIITTLAAAAAAAGPLAAGAAAQLCDPVQVDKLTATGGFPLEEMGTSIAVDGDLMATGATDIGAVYVFRRSGGSWSQEARLTPAGASASPDFGRSVAVMGDRVVVGAPLDFGPGTDAGAVYVFRNTGGSAWAQEARLTPSDAGFNDSFGAAVAARNGLILAGMPGDVVGPEFGAGSVRVFEQSGAGGMWAETATLTASSPEAGALFGSAVGIDGAPGGEVAVIGEPLATTSPGVESGRAYLFRRGPGPELFIEQDQFTQPGPMDGDGFGSSVAVSANAAVIGVPGRRFAFTFMFSPVSIGFPEPSGVSISGFPSAVAVDNGVRLLGCRLCRAGFGSALLSVFADGLWLSQGFVDAVGGGPGDRFGVAVAIQGDTAFVGAPGEDGNGTNAGAVYVFDLGCSPDCPADVNGDGVADSADFFAWVVAFGSMAPECDVNGDGLCTGNDFFAWVQAFGQGCD